MGVSARRPPCPLEVPPSPLPDGPLFCMFRMLLRRARVLSRRCKIGTSFCQQFQGHFAAWRLWCRVTSKIALYYAELREMPHGGRGVWTIWYVRPQSTTSVSLRRNLCARASMKLESTYMQSARAGGEWQKALHLLNDFGFYRLEPTAITFNSVRCPSGFRGRVVLSWGVGSNSMWWWSGTGFFTLK